MRVRTRGVGKREWKTEESVGSLGKKKVGGERERGR